MQSAVLHLHLLLQKRAADEDVYDLGEKLHNKLEHKKEEMEEMYGNMTCMLRECNVLDSENKFYPEGIKMEFEQMKIKDQWLKSELEKYCDQCIEVRICFLLERTYFASALLNYIH